MKKNQHFLLALLCITLMLTTLISCESLEPVAAEAPEEVQEQIVITAPETEIQPKSEAEPVISEEAVEEPAETVIEEPIEEEPLEEPVVETPEEPEPEEEAVTEEEPVEIIEEPSETAEVAAEPVSEEPAEETAIEAPAPTGEKRSLYVLHTNDIYGHVSDSSVNGIGLAKIASIVSRYENEVENLLILDAGDAFTGTTFASLDQGQSVISLMGAIGYDAMTAGDQDLSYGADQLVGLQDIGGFPILSANLLNLDEQAILPEYEIFSFDDLTVGVFGLMTTETYKTLDPEKTEGLLIEDPIEAARRIIEEISPMTDFIIAVTHLGISEGSSDTALRLAEQVEGIDLIVDGHSQTALPVGLKVADSLIVQAGRHTEQLGAVEITMIGDTVTNMTAQLYSKAATEEAGIEPKDDIAALLANLKEDQLSLTTNVIAFSEELLDGEVSEVQTRPTNFSKLLTAAMVEATGADGALINGGSIKASIPLGEITLGDVLTALPLDQSCIVIEVTGQEIYDAVEHGLSMIPEPSSSYSQLGNMVALYNIFEEPLNRVYKIKIGEDNVDKEAVYRLATTDLIASGGAGYNMFEDNAVLSEAGPLDTLFEDYLRKYLPLSE